MKLTRVTITGADDSIQPGCLLPLTERYPFVEWGVLLSAKRSGEPRFPASHWWDRLYDVAGKQRINMAVHLCGSMVRDACVGKWVQADQYGLALFRGLFQRVQLNFGREPLDVNETAFTNGLRGRSSQQFIFQMQGGPNDWLLGLAVAAGIDAVPLFDASGGLGLLPTAWPQPIGPCSGYAGGLSPENLAEQLPRIANAAGDCQFWIDTESGVRTGDRFDLAKVERFLEIAAPHVSWDSR